LVASKTLVDEPYQRWKVEVDFLKDITEGDDTLKGNALLLQKGVVIACSRFNIRDGVRHPNMLIARIENTADLTDVGMEKEDLGRMMSTF